MPTSLKIGELTKIIMKLDAVCYKGNEFGIIIYDGFNPHNVLSVYVFK